VYDSELPVIIIGAGPYGLSIAAHLDSLGIAFKIFGEPMQSWRECMPRGMHLKSEGFASDLYQPAGELSLRKYCEREGLPYRDIGDPVPVERFIAYGMAFQARFVPQLERKAVRAVRREGNGFVVVTATGESHRARRIVVATGITHFGWVPPPLENQPPELISHSSAHADPARFKGRRVGVIGGGSSAIDTAALLHEAGAAVEVIARRQTIAFHNRTVEPRPLLQRIKAPWSGLGLGWRSRLCTDAPLLFHAMPERFRLLIVKRHLGPAPGWFMKDRVIGRFPLHLGTSISRAEVRDGRIRIGIERHSGGSDTREFEHVIAATGYRPEIRRLPFLDPALLEGTKTAEGTPVLDRNFQSSVPGLYYVGLASANSFGPLVRFAFGAGFTARHLSRHLAVALQKGADPSRALTRSAGGVTETQVERS
jgi:thioredoxin reductase